MYCSAFIIAPPADKRNFFLCRIDHSDHRDTLSVFVFDAAGNAIIAFGEEFFCQKQTGRKSIRRRNRSGGGRGDQGRKGRFCDFVETAGGRNDLSGIYFPVKAFAPQEYHS